MRDVIPAGAGGAFARELRAALDLAERAGALAVRHLQAGVAAEHKEDGEPVTAADREADALIVGEIRRRFPDDAVLSEEAPDDGERHRRERVWMVDPIDGTSEFVRGRQGWSVMIGLCERGLPVLGVVHQAPPGRTWAAALGSGAFADGSPIRVSAVTDLAGARMVSSRSHRDGRLREARERLAVADDLPAGGLGVKVCLVAEGARDLYVNTSRRSKLWDACAPQAILEQAGGRLTDATGAAIDYRAADPRNLRGLLATNGLLHAAALARLAPLFR